MPKDLLSWDHLARITTVLGQMPIELYLPGTYVLGQRRSRTKAVLGLRHLHPINFELALVWGLDLIGNQILFKKCELDTQKLN